MEVTTYKKQTLIKISHGDDELGLVKDWLTRVEKFCDSRIETLPDVEVNTREHLVILGDMLEDLLTEQDDLSPKETIKEYETHLKLTIKEISKRDIRMEVPGSRTSYSRKIYPP